MSAPRKRVTLSCAQCSRAFEVQASKAQKQKHCSRSCAQLDRRARERPAGLMTCPTCGKEFFRSKCKRQRSANYCSKECAYKAERTFPERRQGRTVACPTCGETFYIAPASTRRFCSKACFDVAQRGAALVCAQCGKTFWRPSGGPKSRRPVCSRACQDALHRSRPLQPCPYCGELVRSRKDRAHVFCSRAHYEAWKGPPVVAPVAATKAAAPATSPRPKSTAGETTRQRLVSKYHDPRVCKQCGVTYYGHGRIYCSRACANADPDKVRTLAIARALPSTQASRLRAVAALQFAGQNKFETAAYALLDKMGSAYTKQHIIANKFCVDALVESCKLVIQFDGNYWHAHPEMFPDPTPQQKQQRRRDASQDAYLRKCGYTVLRIWERDFKKDKAGIIDRLLAALPSD